MCHMPPHALCVPLQDRMVYKFYRDLINFRGRGEPRLMLRCINPREVSLSSSTQLTREDVAPETADAFDSLFPL